MKTIKKNPQSLLLIILGLSLIIFGGVNYYTSRILSFNAAPKSVQKVSLGSTPTQITIPSVNIDQPVESGEIKDGVWQISYTHATFLETSAPPATGGNIVIYGHNKKAIFGNLPYVSIGQKIFIKTADGETHVYQIYEKDFVKPDRVDLVSPTSFEDLTIYTCYGLFDSLRSVVKAKPVT